MQMRIGRQVVRRFAETMLFWRGRLQARDLQRFAGVSERTARHLTSEWRVQGLLPPYQPSLERSYRLAPDFDLGPSVTDPTVAFSLLLLADCLPGNPFAPFALPGGGHDLATTSALSPPGAPSRPTRTIIAACLDRSAVNLIYASKTGRQEFVFSPSALVRCRGRYHLRGFRADGRDGLGVRLVDRYVDIVPDRAVEAWDASEEQFVDLENDSAWHAIEERQFHLSSELSDAERLCYEHEYGIAETGVLKVQRRRALMPYVVQELAERRCWRVDGGALQVWDIPHGPVECSRGSA